MPGNAILLNGVVQNANREIGVPRDRPKWLAPGVRKYLSVVRAGSPRNDTLCKHLRSEVIFGGGKITNHEPQFTSHESRFA
jgi:hypothetical protein